MNTLVIGNGFDLAHDLPTQYKDFMNFFQFCEILIDTANSGVNLGFIQATFPMEWGKFSDKMQKYITDVFVDCKDIGDIVPDYIREYFLTKEKNCWYEYYKAILNEDAGLVNLHITLAGDNWVDFEKEISRVVKKIENDTITEIIKAGSKPAIIDLKDYINHTKCKNGEELIMYMKQVGLVFSHMNDFIKHIRKELDVFINLMDSYIEFIKNMDIGNQIEDFKDDKGRNIIFHRFISFNYSDTFERNYRDFIYRGDNLDRKWKLEYVHGKAGESCKEDISNLILGCEETLQDNKSSKDTRCAYFKKYMQRDIKNVAYQYLTFYEPEDCSLIEEVGEDGRKYQCKTAYFFGHSLDANDGDIIKSVINNNDNIVIFYYDYDDCIAKINNLITILTKEEYLKNRNKFEYRPQKKKKTK